MALFSDKGSFATMALLRIEPLAKQTTKSDLLKLVCETGCAGRGEIGRIEIVGRQAIIELPDGVAARVANALRGRALHGMPVQASLAQDTTAPHQVTGGESHFARLARLLELESKAEAQRVLEHSRRRSPTAAEESGEALVDLVIVDEDTGLGGRYLVTLVKRSRADLPWSRLGVGAPVLLSPLDNQADVGLRGVVFRRERGSVSVALGDFDEALGEHDRWRLDASNDEIALARQLSALRRAAAAKGDRLADLRKVLLGEREPRRCAENSANDPSLLTSLSFVALNEAQRQAVVFALSAEDLALIHGPPGTGKTTVVAEIIVQTVRRGQKALVTAASNLAVDNLLERLVSRGVRALRLGHPARVSPELVSHTLDVQVESHDDVRTARKLVKDAYQLFRRASRYTRAKPEPGARQATRAEARSLLADARRIEQQTVAQIIDQADVVCATTTALDDDLLKERRFDLGVIDEACQSTEPGCWIPILRSDRLLLAGDHCQLPPTVLSQDAARQGFDVSLFERLAESFGEAAVCALDVQYRMHEQIAAFSAREFYGGALHAADSVCAHRLCDLATVSLARLTESPVEFIDTAGAGFDDEQASDGESRFNPGEARAVASKVRELIEHGVAPSEIAVITPYAAQVRLLRDRLSDIGQLEIDSVDGFQGREKEAVVISLVRSNPGGEIGFLAETRRTNVALTRARRKLIVIGDSATLAAHEFYRRLCDHFEQIGAYRSIWEEGLVD